jgi:hypothetical protein
MSVLNMLVGFRTHEILKDITFEAVITFSRLVSNLKRDILQPQSITESDPEVPIITLGQL